MQFESVRNFSSSTHTSYKATPIACCYMHAAVTRRINSIICTCTQASPWLTSSWRHRQVDEVKKWHFKVPPFRSSWMAKPCTWHCRAEGGWCCCWYGLSCWCRDGVAATTCSMHRALRVPYVGLLYTSYVVPMHIRLPVSARCGDDWLAYHLPARRRVPITFGRHLSIKTYAYLY